MIKKIFRKLMFFFAFIIGTLFSFICFNLGLVIVTGIIMDVNPCLLGAHKGEWTVVTPATCTADGKEETDCTLCGKHVTRKINMIDHVFTPATCTEAEKCEMCGLENGEPLGHNGEWSITTPATCSNIGIKTMVCTRCEENFTEEIPKTEHQEGEWIVTKSATCLEKGESKTHCIVCDEEMTKELPRAEHQAGEWNIITPATCTNTGKETSKCIVCDNEITKEIPKTEHNIEWENEIFPCAGGVHKGKCTICGETIDEK